MKISILECRPREAIQNLERRAEKGQREYGSSFKAGKIRKRTKVERITEGNGHKNALAQLFLSFSFMPDRWNCGPT